MAIMNLYTVVASSEPMNVTCKTTSICKNKYSREVRCNRDCHLGDHASAALDDISQMEALSIECSTTNQDSGRT